MSRTSRGRSASLTLVVALWGCGATHQGVAAPEALELKTEPQATEAAPDVAPAASAVEADEGQSNEGKPVGAAATDPDEAAEGSPLQKLMAVHFRDAERIRAAAIAGAPQDSGPAAESLMFIYDVKDLPKSWHEPAKRMQASAKRVKDSSDVPGVAAATADIGTSCGWCHQRLGGPKIALGEPPKKSEQLAMRMVRHAWGIERLWEGLYAPSNSAWKSGAEVLVGEDFPDELLQKGGVYAKSAASEFSKLVAAAPGKTNQSQRAALYAQLLGTCATCHIAISEKK